MGLKRIKTVSCTVNHEKKHEKTRKQKKASVAYESDLQPNCFFMTPSRSLSDGPMKNYQVKRLGLVFVGSNMLDPIFFS